MECTDLKLIHLYIVYMRIQTSKDCINEKIKSRLNSGNGCYLSVQNFLSSCLLSKNLEIKMHKTIILSIILYVCETWSLTLREGDGLSDLGTGY
jgi:hypothetical protein